MSPLKPDISVKKVTDLDLQKLWRSRKRGLLLDADNSLIPYATMELPDSYRTWLDDALARGFSIVVFTNNFRKRAMLIQELVGLPVVYGWVKPWPWGMARAVKKLGMPKERILLVGDQLFTDILGAKVAGVSSALVDPLAAKEHAWTRLMRRLERLAGR